MDATAAREPSAEEVRSALRRILASATFADKERLRSLLRFIVEEKLNNHSARLKEYSLAVAVFGRDEDFDFRNDSIVRVQARNLRRSLEAYYAGEGREDPTSINIPKGSYVPVFGDRLAGPSEQQRRRARRAEIALPLLAVALAVTAAVFLLIAHSRDLASTIAVMPFLAASGARGEEMAAASLTEELAAELARDRAFRTISAAPRQGAERAGGIIEAGRRSKAGLVLTGVVRRGAGDWHVSARLIRVDDGLNLWSNSYRVTDEGFDGLAASISEAVLGVLKSANQP